MPPPLNPLRFLIVEDEPGDARLLSIVLGIAFPGAGTKIVSRLSEALGALEQGTFDVVLCDLNLPDGYGPQTIAALKTAIGNAALIAVTGEERREVAVAVLEEGAHGYVVKGEVEEGLITRTVSHALNARAGELAFERARFLVDQSLDGFVVSDVAGVIHDANQAFCHIVGRDPQDLLGQSLFDLHAPVEGQPTTGDRLDRIVRQGTDRFVTTLRHHQGHLVEVEVSVQYREESGGEILSFVRDVTEHNRLTRALETSEKRLAATLGAVADAVIAINDRGQIQSFNPAAERIFGWTAQEAIGQNVTLLMPDPYASAHQGYLENFLRTNQPKIIGKGRELVGLRRDGSTFPMDLTVTQARLESPRLFIGIVRDITERKAMEDELRLLATTDPLTGAANRRSFMESLKGAVAQGHRLGHPVAVAMLDIDHFKRLNDTFGHAAGDAALIRFVAEIQERLRETDLLGRLGGEEFALILPATTAEQALEVVNDLRRRRQADCLCFEGQEMRFTLSAGVTDTTRSDPAHLLSDADGALYRAKEQGRNRVLRADPQPMPDGEGGNTP